MVHHTTALRIGAFLFRTAVLISPGRRMVAHISDTAPKDVTAATDTRAALVISTTLPEVPLSEYPYVPRIVCDPYTRGVELRTPATHGALSNGPECVFILVRLSGDQA
ncbi:hypothetical protein DXG01_014055 [Tephrocybe rancida]|nr:hypothetical protein DXG01_014055 [Tephrocybe rancida]